MKHPSRGCLLSMITETLDKSFGLLVPVPRVILEQIKAIEIGGVVLIRLEKGELAAISAGYLYMHFFKYRCGNVIKDTKQVINLVIEFSTPENSSIQRVIQSGYDPDMLTKNLIIACQDVTNAGCLRDRTNVCIPGNRWPGRAAR